MALSEVDILNDIAAKIGTESKTINKSVTDATQNGIRAWLQGSIDSAKQQLADDNRLASRRLYESIRFSAGNVVFEVVAEDYADFVNKGVDGLEVKHGSPFSFRTPHPSQRMADSIRQWIPERGVTLPPGISTYEALSYAIATNVKKKGIRPTPFIQDNFSEKNVKQLARIVEKAIGSQVIFTLRTTIQPKA
jgi:hypothetical protein